MNSSYQPSLKEVFVLVGFQWLLTMGIALLLLFIQMIFPGTPSAAAGPVGILLGANLYVQMRKKQPEFFAPPARLRWLAFYAACISTFLQGTLLGLAYYYFHWLDGFETLPREEMTYLIPGVCVFLWVFSFLGTWSGLSSGHRLLQKTTIKTP